MLFVPVGVRFASAGPRDIVIVEESWYERLAEASEDEEDMLDLAFDLQRTSRLGCQIVMTEELDGLTVYLPGETRNMLLG